MMFFVSSKTNEVIRDDNGKVIYANLNTDPICSDVIKKHGSVWLHYEDSFGYSKPHNYDLSEK